MRCKSRITTIALEPYACRLRMKAPAVTSFWMNSTVLWASVADGT